MVFYSCSFTGCHARLAQFLPQPSNLLVRNANLSDIVLNRAILVLQVLYGFGHCLWVCVPYTAGPHERVCTTAKLTSYLHYGYRLLLACAMVALVEPIDCAQER